MALTQEWRKSEASAHNGNCVEVCYRTSSHSHAANNCVEVGWGKSSHSESNGHCVEVGGGCGQVHVRDSKNPSGPVLSFSRNEWEAFTAGIRAQGMN